MDFKGTILEAVHFRRAMLKTLVTVGQYYNPFHRQIDDISLDKGVRSLLPSFPLLKPHQSVASHFKSLEALITARDPTWLRRYDVLIQQARYAEREPSQQDYEECALLASYLNEMWVSDFERLNLQLTSCCIRQGFDFYLIHG